MTDTAIVAVTTLAALIAYLMAGTYLVCRTGDPRVLEHLGKAILALGQAVQAAFSRGESVRNQPEDRQP